MSIKETQLGFHCLADGQEYFPAEPYVAPPPPVEPLKLKHVPPQQEMNFGTPEPKAVTLSPEEKAAMETLWPKEAK